MARRSRETDHLASCLRRERVRKTPATPGSGSKKVVPSAVAEGWGAQPHDRQAQRTDHRRGRGLGSDGKGNGGLRGYMKCLCLKAPKTFGMLLRAFCG
jgi:hypothetical protein